MQTLEKFFFHSISYSKTVHTLFLYCNLYEFRNGKSVYCYLDKHHVTIMYTYLNIFSYDNTQGFFSSMTQISSCYYTFCHIQLANAFYIWQCSFFEDVCLFCALFYETYVFIFHFQLYANFNERQLIMAVLLLSTVYCTMWLMGQCRSIYTAACQGGN